MSSSAFDDVIRKAIDLNVRYYSAVGRLTLDYWREVFATATETAKSGLSKSRFAGNEPAAAPTAPPKSAAPKAAVMVIEAEAGAVGIGVFLVENHLGTEVDSAVVATAFKSPQGVEIAPTFTFDPPRVVLQPSEQILVRVTTTLGPELEADTRYSGEFVVPGLKGTRIPVVLRGRTRQ